MKTSLNISAMILSTLLLSYTPHQLGKKEVSSEVSVAAKSSIKWKSTDIALGDIVQNRPITIEFELTNEGETPVIISNVQASCGCTSTNYPKTPLLPGESSKITAVYNAAAKGVFKKQVTVFLSNMEAPVTLSFTGTVI
jgi:hypothetical protein